jgi:hypothetical protein
MCQGNRFGETASKIWECSHIINICVVCIIANRRAPVNMQRRGRLAKSSDCGHAVQVVFEGLDPETMAYSLSAPTVRRVGGKLDPESFQTLALRIILDHSLLEVFTGTGQVISTRVYRGAPPTSDACIDFLSFGGSAEVAALNAWEMGTVWQHPQVWLALFAAGELCTVLRTSLQLLSGMDQLCIFVVAALELDIRQSHWLCSPHCSTLRKNVLLCVLSLSKAGWRTGTEAIQDGQSRSCDTED